MRHDLRQPRGLALALALALMIAGLVVPGGPAVAEMCVLDPVPAATLLLPYFEVDLEAEPGAGVNTVFTIHNALPEPTIAHITLWTDWSQPTLNFDVFLTGYDVQAVDLYDLLVGRNVPVTADDQSDQGQNTSRAMDPTSSCDGTDDSCSPHGSHPSWDGSFFGNGAPGTADCIDIFPFFVNPLLTGILAKTGARHAGQPFDGECFSSDHGDGRARGYVTIDNATACSLVFPSNTDVGYFSDGVDPGIASNVNQLWGDWSLIDPSNPLTLAVDPLVHIEADDAFDSNSTSTGYTFYGRYTEGLGGIDNREPLATAWGFSFRNVHEWVTDLVVWRDSKVDDQDFSVGYPCGSGPDSGPDWQPLSQTQVVCFNQTEGAVEICSDADCFPLETQRLALGSGDLDVPFTAGWCQLDLNLAGEPISRDGSRPPVPPEVAQSWVGATVRGGNAVAGGLNATVLSHACQDVSPTIPVNLFVDGFESGDTSTWTTTVP